MVAHMLSPITSPARADALTSASVFAAEAAATVHPPAATSAFSCPDIQPQYPTNTIKLGSCSGLTALKSLTCQSPGKTSEVAPSNLVCDSATRHLAPFSVPIGPPMLTCLLASTRWCGAL